MTYDPTDPAITIAELTTLCEAWKMPVYETTVCDLIARASGDSNATKIAREHTERDIATLLKQIEAQNLAFAEVLRERDEARAALKLAAGVTPANEALERK
jgi:hypothetical protein